MAYVVSSYNHRYNPSFQLTLCHSLMNEEFSQYSRQYFHLQCFISGRNKRLNEVGHIPTANWKCAFKFLGGGGTGGGGMHYASETGFLQEGMLQLPSLASPDYREKNAEARMSFCMANRCIHRNLHFLRALNILGDS